MSELPSVRYLVKVEPGANNNKYYRQICRGANWVAEYGRVGASCQTRTYPMSMWESKYKEKLRKGYVDRTNLVEDLIRKEAKKNPGGYKEIADRAIAQIVDRLLSMAKQAVEQNYTVTSNQVTAAMISRAQEQLARLTTMGDASVQDFNSALIELFGIIPRKMGAVSAYIATKRDDFGPILEREQDLLDVMKGQVYIPPAPIDVAADADDDGQTILEAKHLVFEEIDNDDKAVILSSLGSCADHFVRAWRVTNLDTQAKFNAYVKDNVRTKLLWHGSRNENWWSIVGSGLVLRPTNAVITGKMFGYGIYFATKARKSMGYTSLSGSYWARGSSSSAFMGLYEVAYGKPYDVYSFSSGFYNLNYEGLQRLCPGANCLHAHEGQMLRNDEIIVYQECQTTIKYLVELKS